ncbi:MAG: CHAD domain-containing protein [Alphaproteobacteria bacterium]|nr:CHAD domain-containing protein [Alphaproteobacteria bacterium]
MSRLVSTYFDTADHDLKSRGMVLRIREADGGFIQTVKSGRAQASDTDAAFARGEWEDAVAGNGPDATAPNSGRYIDAALVGRLIPVFRTEVERRKVDLAAESDTQIEAAIDRGFIHSIVRDAKEPISEVELELKSGSANLLYDVALDLLAEAPLRLSLVSKGERGYLLAANETTPIEAVHSPELTIDPTISGNEALRRIGIACLMQMAQNEPAVLAGLGEGIHQMRVAVRRLRAILSAFGKYLPAEARRAVSGELRWLADAMGAARNLDAFETSLLPPAQKALGDEAGLEALTAAAGADRREAFAKSGRAVRSTRFTRLLLQQFRWFEACEWREQGASPELEQPIADLAATVLDRRRRAAKRCSRNLADQSPADRHKLRIALKKLRYSTELLAALYADADVDRFTKRLKRLQSHLGDANDIRVAHEIVHELAARRRNPELVTIGEAMLDWHEQRIADLEPRLHKEVERLLAVSRFWSVQS